MSAEIIDQANELAERRLEMTSQRSGFFIMKTLLSGKTHHALRAYKHLIREAKR
ncbi:hypothetical protein [Klebsiella variicola]|uniref:hypothetical protein n=1 Tax=Klebsiella variicola TaxID=244366 RepID=UPI001F542E28|nr:hypothetical protein [Klebsiella variicola]